MVHVEASLQVSASAARQNVLEKRRTYVSIRTGLHASGSLYSALCIGIGAFAVDRRGQEMPPPDFCREVLCFPVSGKHEIR